MASKLIDLTGQVFGRLTVLRRSDSHPSYNRRAYWDCKCTCGRTCSASSSYLRKGLTVSCGCKRRGLQADLTGQVFGRWTVVRRAENDANGNVRWLCKCTCGKTKTVQRGSLQNGTSQSCGCLQVEKVSLPPGEGGLNRLFDNYRNSARRAGRPFTLPIEQFEMLTSAPCAYCGAEPQGTSTSRGVQKAYRGRRTIYRFNGIDRVDNSLGYTLENCIPCCEHCNRAKWKWGKDEFFSWVKRIYTNLRQCGELK